MLNLRGSRLTFIFKTLFLLPFLNFKNIGQISLSGIGLKNKIKKDALYDFAKNPSIPWRNILSLFNKRILHVIHTKGDHSDIISPKCFILDDTIIPKRGKVIEQIGKVFDHCSHKYILGLKMLTLGYWDGK